MTTSSARRRPAGAVRRRRRRKPQARKSFWRRLNDSDIFSKKKPKKTEVVAFTRELATLLDADGGRNSPIPLAARRPIRADLPYSLQRRIGRQEV